MEIKKLGNIHEIKFEYSGSDWEQWIFLLSDIHYDSKDCDREMLKRDLDYAQSLGAKILIGGDLADCMGGKYDPRTHKGDLRPEYEVANYFDVVEYEAVKFLKKYSDDIIYMGRGNHEENVLQRHEVDLTNRIARGIKCPAVGDYSGWIRFSFYNPSGQGKRHANLYRNHGNGGSSPVTRDVISTARNAAIYDADIVWTEHTHTQWDVPLRREKTDKLGSMVYYSQRHVKTGTYNDKPKRGRNQWDSKFGPPNKGGVLLRFNVEGRRQKLRTRVMI